MAIVLSFLARITVFFTNAIVAIAANAMLRGIILSVAVLIAAAFLIVAVIRISRRLDRALRGRKGIREFRLKSWKIASAEQALQATLRGLFYLRMLALTAIFGAALWGLALVLFPAIADRTLALARGAWLVLATLLVWLIMLRVFRGVGSSILAAISSNEHTIKPLKYMSFTILSAPIIEKGMVLAIKLVGWAALLSSLAVVVALSLSYFSFTLSWAQAILSVFWGLIKPILEAIVGYLPKLIFGVIIVVIARILLKLLKAFFGEIEAGRLGLARFDREWAQTTYKIVRLIIMVLTVVMIFPYIPGSGSDAFKTVAIFLGVLLSLGSTSFVGNIMAGVSLTYMNPFRMGDRVKIGDITGDIVEKTLLITRIRTIKNVIVTVPNSVVLSREVENFSSRSKDARLILHTTVTIGYEVPWRDVQSALLAAVPGVEGLLENPPPFVLQTALDNYFVAYQLNVSTDDPNRMATIYSDLHRSIQDSFAKVGIEIMTPSYYSLRDGSRSTIPGDRRGASG
jgi:small-conductance mechanosensitive channel